MVLLESFVQKQCKVCIITIPLGVNSQIKSQWIFDPLFLLRYGIIRFSMKKMHGFCTLLTPSPFPLERDVISEQPPVSSKYYFDPPTHLSLPPIVMLLYGFAERPFCIILDYPSPLGLFTNHVMLEGEGGRLKPCKPKENRKKSLKMFQI